MKFNNLFTSCDIRGLHLKNRIILPAMGTRMAGEKGEITPRLIAYHKARAKGGCALNIVEVAAVHTPSAPAHFVSISEDSYIEGHKKLTDAIHEAGGKAGVQLWQGSIAVGMDPKAKMFVVNDLNLGQYTLPAITIEEIKEVVEAYGKGAKRAALAGYDCVEFHCAHNYLPHSFLSGGLNHRTDEYGGSFENRCRFPLECIREIRKNIPEDMPLFMRIDAQDDCLPNGLSIDEVVAFCKLAQKEGVDVLDVSRGNIITPATVYEVPPLDIPRGFNVSNAEKIRKETGMLTIAVGRINTPEQAEEIIANEQADFVVVGRGQLADPEFCLKAEEGRSQDIVNCVGCNQGCYDGFCDVVNRPFITCLRNPMIGHEEEWTIEPTKDPKRVAIIGGGMAGLEAAKVLKERGHLPEIFEASNQLGGQFITAGKAPGKQEMEVAADNFGKQVEAMGVPVHYETKVDVALLEKETFDQVIVAAGAEPIKITLPGQEKKHIVDSHSLLNGTEDVEGSVCVIGGGLVGLEVADYLAGKGHEVHVVEMQDEAGKDLGNLRKICVNGKLKQLHVDILCNSKCVAITNDGVQIENNGETKVVACDSVVMAIGARSRDTSDIQAYCENHQIPVYVIGDAKKARRALNAVEEAFEVARTL